MHLCQAFTFAPCKVSFGQADCSLRTLGDHLVGLGDTLVSRLKLAQEALKGIVQWSDPLVQLTRTTVMVFADPQGCGGARVCTFQGGTVLLKPGTTVFTLSDGWLPTRNLGRNRLQPFHPTTNPHQCRFQAAHSFTIPLFATGIFGEVEPFGSSLGAFGWCTGGTRIRSPLEQERGMRDGVIPHPHHVIDRAPGCANIGFAERAPVRPINMLHIEPGLAVPASTTAPASPPTLAYHPIRSTIERSDTLNRHLGLTEGHAFVGWTARFPPEHPWDRVKDGRGADTMVA